MTTTPPAPTITVVDDANPCPRANVLITPMPADAATVTVWRIYAGRKTLVRGGNKTPVAGDHLVIDYEVPLQTPVVYVCQTTNATGTPSAQSPPSAAVTVNDARAWLHDPLAPATAVTVVYDSSGATVGVGARAGSFAAVTRAADVTLSPVLGGDLPIAASGPRRQPSAVPLDLRALDADSAGQLRDLFAQAFPVCLRTGLAVPQLPPVVYLSVGELVEAHRPSTGVSVFTGTADTVQPPGASVIVPVRTYDQLGDEAATYTGLSGLYSTYTQVQQGH